MLLKSKGFCKIFQSKQKESWQLKNVDIVEQKGTDMRQTETTFNGKVPASFLSVFITTATSRICKSIQNCQRKCRTFRHLVLKYKLSDNNTNTKQISRFQRDSRHYQNNVLGKIYTHGFVIILFLSLVFNISLCGKL